MIEQAQQHIDNGNFPAAEVLYRSMLEDEPENAEVLFMLSLVRQAQDDLEEPVELLLRAIAAQPRNPTLHYSLGMVQLRRKQMDAAEKSFYQATGVDPNFVAAQNGIAIVELSRGRFAAAEHALRRAMKSEPDNTGVLINMGIALMEQGRAGDAIGYLQRVVSAEPDNVAAHIYLGKAFVAAGNAGFAAQCFANALEIQPQSTEALRLLGQAQLDSGRFAEAAQSFRGALDQDLDTPEVVAGLARALRALGRNREAEGAFLRALRLAGGAEELLLDLAEMLLEEGRCDEVISRLAGRIEGASNGMRLTRLLADARLQTGDAAGAMLLLRPLLADGAPSAKMRLLFARALLASGEPAASDAQVERLLSEDAPPVEALLFRAGELLRRGEEAVAMEHLRSAQRRHDLTALERRNVLELLATTLHRNGNYQAAWEQYLGLEPREAAVIRIRAEKPLQLEADEAAETAMDRDVAWSWPPQPVPDGRPEPIFLFAWPGSGRQDLVRALSGHPGMLVVADGLPGEQSKRRLGISHPRGKGPLNALSVAQVQLARRKYWKSLRQQHAEAGTLATVDPMPLTVEAFPTLYRLFPQARMLVLRQDPRDLAVAWLQAGYRDLAGMARQYCQQLQLLERCQASVPIKYIEIDAAQLHADPGVVLRNMISELALAWDAGVEQAFVSAPSTDLAEPGAWRHYEPWLQTVFEELEA